MHMTLTKELLIESIRESTQLKRGEGIRILESLLEILKQTLESGEDVLISGFGKFCVREKERRRGRNPQTGEEATLRERRVVTFKTSGVLRTKINSRKRARISTYNS
jgi:integration host factor subunit alpha